MKQPPHSDDASVDPAAEQVCLNVPNPPADPPGSRRLWRWLWRLLLALLFLLLLLMMLSGGLWLGLAHWLPPLLAHWLPAHTRIELAQGKINRQGVTLPLLRFWAGDCLLLRADNLNLRYAQGWRMRLASLYIDDRCIRQLPASQGAKTVFSLSQWQKRLQQPGWLSRQLAYGSLRIEQLRWQGLEDYAGQLSLTLRPQQQRLDYHGSRLTLVAALQGNQLTVRDFRMLAHLQQAATTETVPSVPDNSSGTPGGQPVAASLVSAPFTVSSTSALPFAAASLAARATALLTLADNGLPVSGQLTGHVTLPANLSAALALPTAVQADLRWQDGQGQLLVTTAEHALPLLDLPWSITANRFSIYDGRWHWQQPVPLSGRVSVKLTDWQAGLEQAQMSARLSVQSQGQTGKGNAVLTVGPAPLMLGQTPLPLQLTGQGSYQALRFYASIPARLHGDWQHPQLHLLPGALLRLKGQLISGLNIDHTRWPLAGVKLSAEGINGRLQAILRGHDAVNGDFVLHLDGNASNFLPDSGLWRWKYWGQGNVIPMQAHWHTQGSGEWRDNRITLTALNSDFNQLRYGGLQMDSTRLTLRKPVVWQRDTGQPRFTGQLLLDNGTIAFAKGGGLPPSTLDFSVEGSAPDNFRFSGHWQSKHSAGGGGIIGPLRLSGRWDGTRLRGEAWWPEQPLNVLQPLLSPGLKMKLDDGQIYAQVAFSAAPVQGLLAGGHAVVKNGGGWLDQTRIEGVDFILPFSVSQNQQQQHAQWRLGLRQPVSLQVARIDNSFHLRQLTAEVQGNIPWSETRPLVINNVGAALFGGQISLRHWRFPQQGVALLRVRGLESSALISALKVKTMALSGRLDGELPIWLSPQHEIIHHGWLSNPAALTLRMDTDLIDKMVKNNGAAASAINWLRYLEINPHSWIAVNLNRQGDLRLRANLQGTGEVDGKRGTVRLNYHHEDNIFELWRNLRFGDNLQNWLEQQLDVPTCCQPAPEQRQP